MDCIVDRNSTRSLLLCVCAMMCGVAFAAEDENQVSRFAALNGDGESVYKDEGGFGGPATIGAKLEVDNQTVDPFYRVPIRVMKGWYDTKARINEEHGIQYGFNYVAVHATASDTISSGNEDNATGGIFTGLASWKLFDGEHGGVGKLNLKVEDRHTINSEAEPQFLGLFESGYYSLPATGFRDYSLRVQELNWSYSSGSSKTHFVGGKVDPTNYYAFHGMKIPSSAFLGYGWAGNGTVSWPEKGAGVFASFMPTDNVYVTGGIHDVEGDTFGSDRFELGDHFTDGRNFTALEVGYVPSFAERYIKKMSIMYWHADKFETSAEGEGFVATAHWWLKDRYMPFITYGQSDGNGFNALYKKSFSIGNGIRFKSHDVLGVGINWSEPNFSTGPEQVALEVYYRFHITEHLAITPDLQFVRNPSLDESRDNLVHFNLRLRFTL